MAHMSCARILRDTVERPKQLGTFLSSGLMRQHSLMNGACETAPQRHSPVDRPYSHRFCVS